MTMLTIESKRLLAVLATLILFSALALAATAEAEGNGAAVFHNGECSYQNAGDTIEVFIDSTKKQKVETKAGNIIITCHFTAADVTKGAPMRFLEAGFVCTVSGVDTTDSQFKMNARGTATLHCVVHH
jgi:hypothetical protein